MIVKLHGFQPYKLRMSQIFKKVYKASFNFMLVFSGYILLKHKRRTKTYRVDAIAC
jgi:hypothetical protein